MYEPEVSLLVKLMLIAVLSQLVISFSEFANCRSQACLQQVERRSRDILKIDWKPISVWPEEGKCFHKIKSR